MKCGGILALSLTGVTMARSGWVVGVVALMLGSSAGAQSGATGGEKKEVIATGGVLSSLTAEL